MAQGKIMITGATGFVGSAILVDILQAGYTANIVVRSEQKAKKLQEAPAIAALNKASACKYFIVPDLTAEGGLDEATAGTDIVIHCASPLPFLTSDTESEFIVPAVKGTLGALESARKSGTVKRVIMLSSMGAFAAPEIVEGPYVPPEEVFLSDKPNEDFDPPYSSPLIAYCAAKTAAYRRSVEWMEKAVAEGSVSFDMISLAPAYLFGTQPLATGVADLMQTSNGLLLNMIMGTGNTSPEVTPEEGQTKPQTLCGGVLMQDFIEIVHKSLDSVQIKTPASGPSKQIATYVHSAAFKWNDAYPILARKWPREVEMGILADRGDFPTKPNINYANGPTEEAYAMKLKDFEGILDGVVPYYLDIMERDRLKQQAV